MHSRTQRGADAVSRTIGMPASAPASNLPAAARQTRRDRTIQRRWNSQERDQALLALIACGGHAERAAEQLKAQGLPIPRRTLSDWRHRYADRLRELHDRHAPAIEAELVRRAREVALQAFAAAAQAVEHAEADLEAGRVKDTAGAARNLATTGAIAADKLMALTGRPTQVIEHREPSQIIASLRRKGIVIDLGTDAVREQPTAPDLPAGKDQTPDSTD